MSMFDLQYPSQNIFYHNGQRILQAGGFVAERRVCRCLAVSRALGDHYFKNSAQPPSQRMVSCIPVR